MKCLGMLFFLLCIGASAMAQSDVINKVATDTSISKVPPRAKRPWAYSNYQEFLDNKPSILSGFTIVADMRDDTLPTGAATIKFDDSVKHKPKVWGFSDGNMVYVAPPKGFLAKKVYVPLEYIGKYSFYVILERDSYAVGPGLITKLVSAAVTSKTSRLYSQLMVIDEKGKSQEADVDYLLKLFKQSAVVYHAYYQETVTDKYQKMREYLVRFNESL